MGKRGIVIAIDGPAGSGKSTTARRVAGRLEYLYLDTGAMYRAVGLTMIRRGLDPDDESAAAGTAAALEFDFRSEASGQRVLINGEDVTGEIRSADVSDAASRVAVHAAVRRILVARQRELGFEGGIVMEGRDTGTAVFPDAELKIFLVADVAERARRRQRELRNSGVAAELDELMGQIRERDTRDSATQRRSGPWPASDAVSVDTTGLDVAAQVARVVELARERGV
ncbi:MAG: (d)CMP kinase [Gemmatimonadota bacterium]|nr:(d)CMP kinase [Gemmatimonadota bacterium]